MFGQYMFKQGSIQSLIDQYINWVYMFSMIVHSYIEYVSVWRKWGEQLFYVAVV